MTEDEITKAKKAIEENPEMFEVFTRIDEYFNHSSVSAAWEKWKFETTKSKKEYRSITDSWEESKDEIAPF